MRYAVTRVLIVGAASVAFFSIVAAGAAGAAALGSPESAAPGLPKPAAPDSPEPAAPAPQRAAILGYATCENCHETSGRHDNETNWYRELDGNPGFQHADALNQIFEPKAEEFYAAAGSPGGDFYEWVEAEDGLCGRCHVTFVNGSPDYGVTCESCHGPGEDYLEVHKTEGAYQDSVDNYGMNDVLGKPENWVPVCLSCHILDDDTLISVGHPSGDEWDIGEKYTNTQQHFVTNRNAYSPDQIRGIATPLIADIRSRRASTVVDPGSAPSDPGPSAADPSEPRPDAGTTTIIERVTVEIVEVPVERIVVEEIVADPLPRTDAGTTTIIERVTVEIVEVPVERIVVEEIVADPLPRTPAAVVGAVQGRLISLLGQLLSRNATTAVQVIPDEDLPGYSGADAALLRLQQEVIALALEALRQPPSEGR